MPETRQSTGPPSASDMDVHDPSSSRIDTGVVSCLPSGRIHYRIVFKEVAGPLHTVRNLSDVFIALRDTAKGTNHIRAFIPTPF